MKVAIIGVGNVGATIAYTLLLGGKTQTISLIDVNEKKVLGEVEDLRHGLSFSEPVDILAEGHEGIRDADVIILAAGRNRRPDETRLDLAKANVATFEKLVEDLRPHYRDAIFIVVSNPMDVLTQVVYKRLGIPKAKVIGSGTTLDSARFRYLLSREFDIDPRNIHAYVIGEHGDSAVPVWSMASLGQIPITQYASERRKGLTLADLQRIHEGVIGAGKGVIQQKGATYYAIALSVARILEAIAGNERSVLTVSSYIEDFHGVSDVCLSLPAVIDGTGIRELLPIHLDEAELAKLRQSAEALRQVLDQTGY